MSQITWRASGIIVERVRQSAAQQGRSMNDYITRVLDAATNPELADTETQKVRERLDRAGLLAKPHSKRRIRPSEQELAIARREAGRGTPLSDIVSGERE